MGLQKKIKEYFNTKDNGFVNLQSRPGLEKVMHNLDRSLDQMMNPQIIDQFQ